MVDGCRQVRWFHKRVNTGIFLIFVHIVFFYCILLHLRITFAGTERVDPQALVKHWKPARSSIARLVSILPTTILSSSPKSFDLRITRSIIHEVDATGQPFRCWRDKCNGHWKAPRMRHCGICGECRFFFDHHCLWFDNDVVAPETMGSFLLLTVILPVLFFCVSIPITQLAFLHVKLLWQLGHNTPAIFHGFYQKWWSWCFGPVLRTLIGLYLASGYVAESYPDGFMFSSDLPRPTLRLPSSLLLGTSFGLIALGLAGTTLTQLSKNVFSVEIQRERSLRKLVKSGKKDKATLEKILQLQSPSYFWVPKKNGIVKLPSGMVPYDHGWRTNLAMHFGFYTQNPFTVSDQVYQYLVNETL